GLPNRDRAGPDETVVIGGVTCSYQLVQLGERTHSGHRNEMVAAEPSDLAFHPTLLMGPLDAGDAVEAVEPVMGTQPHKPRVLQAAAAQHDPDHRQLQVVIADPCGHPGEPFERLDMP